MSAIDGPLAPRAMQRPQPLEAPKGTLEKIKEFMCRFVVIGTVFSILAGVAIAVLWGVKFGLIAAGIGLLATMAIKLCIRAPQAEAASNPAEEILPSQRPYDREAVRAFETERQIDHMENINRLIQFNSQVTKEIYKRSPHFDNQMALFTYLRDEFRMDFSRISLLYLNPIRKGEREGYEVTILSEVPKGWIKLYLPKEQGFPVSRAEGNLQRIDRVAPFLDRIQTETNYLYTLDLPFREVGDLMLNFVSEYRQMDLTKVKLDSIRNVTYERVYMPMPGVVVDISQFEGYELNFATPNGLVRYYADLEGKHIADVQSARNVVPRYAPFYV